MRDSRILTLKIIAMEICLILGTLFHFTYEWSGENTFVGLFSSIDESVWEHLKLVFYPILIVSRNRIYMG